MNLRLFTRRTTAQSAFTVAEVTMAVGVVGLVMIAVLTGFSFGFSLLKSARENLRATQILQEKMETIRLYSWDQINTPGFVPGTFQAAVNPMAPSTNAALYQGSVYITNAPISEAYTNDLRQMVVEISWTNSGITHHRKMTTLISRYGLQNYVY